MGERVRRSSCEVVLLNQLKAHTSTSSDTPPNLHIQILLVDDEPTCLSIVAKLLKQCSPSEDETMKLRVTITASPHEALKALREKENTFDIVIMNLHMHEVNGTVFQKQVVRELHVPVIVMSADEDENLMLKTLEDGAILYLLKPIHKEDLKHVWQYAITTKKKGKSAIVEEEEENNLDLRDTVAITTTKRGEPDIVQEEENNLDGRGTKPAEPSVLNNGASNVSKVEEQKSIEKKVEVDGSKRGRDDGGDDDEEDIELHLRRRAKKKPKVVWTSTLHTRFLMAINHLGNDKAVPKRILQLMGVPGLTRENIASHLQKYRQFVKRVAETNKVPSILSQRRVQSNFASDLSIFQRRTTLEDFEMMRQKRLNPLYETTYKIGSSFINPTQHDQPFLSRTRESSNFQTHLLHSGTTSQGSLANSSLGFGNVMGLMQNRQPMHLPRFGDNSTFCNNLATSQFGAYSNYNRISDTSPIENQLRLMYSTAYSHKLNFNTHTNNMRLNGTSYDVISGATTNPSLDRSSTVGLLPNIGFNGETIGLRNWVSNGYVNVAPTLTRINGSLGFGSASSSQLPSLSTNPPFTSPLNNQLSSPFCQQLNLLGSSNGRGGFENHVDVSNIMSTDHHLLHGIKEGGMLLQSNSSIAAPASNINQQQNGITAELGFLGDNSNFSDVEMNNLVAQLPQYPSFSDELSPHTVQTTNIEELLDASHQVQAVPMHVNSTNFDGVSNVQSGFSPVNDKQQEDGVAEFTNSSEMNNLATDQLPSSDFSDELLYNTDLTIDIDMLLDDSDKVEGVQEQANPTNFDDLVHEFNPVDDKRASPNEGSEEGTADLSPTNSFLAEIESMMEDKDWTDQFIGSLCENDVWTSF